MTNKYLQTRAESPTEMSRNIKHTSHMDNTL